MSPSRGPNSPTVTSDELLARFQTLHPKLIDLSLERIRRLLADLGDPHLDLPPVIHVAGTKGKGSTIAYLKAMLEAAGKSVHTYTSPNLVRFHERIVVRGKEISEPALVDLLLECEQANQGRQITFFEITNVAAFLAFARTKADFSLIEVGLGGRFDSTNVIENPIATIITALGIDHTEFLGPTLADIAYAKAGILKPGAPAIIARQPEEAEAVITREAAKLGVELWVAGQEFDAHEEQGRLVYQDGDGLLDLPLPKLFGRHQVGNAALAVATLRRLKIRNVGEDAIAEGLRSVVWPARLQRLTRGPLIELGPEGSDIWLDGAHNVMSGEALAGAISEIEERSPRPLYLILGMLRTKDAEGLLAAFKGLARHVFTVPVALSPASLSAGALYDIATGLGFDARPARDPEEAMAFAAETAEAELEAGDSPRILICGSLYLAGEVLADNG